MRIHHKTALALTAPWVVLLGYDFTRRISSGTGTWVTDGDLVQSRALAVAGTLAIGAMFASLAWVVHAERPHFAHAPAPARWARRPLLVSLIALTIGFCLVSSTQVALGINNGLFNDISGLVGFVAISGLSLSALTVGLASARSMALGYGGRILALILPTVLLGAAAALLAHFPLSPVFGTLVALLGLATLGLGAEAPTPAQPVHTHREAGRDSLPESGSHREDGRTGGREGSTPST